jgi:putative hydrolase
MSDPFGSAGMPGGDPFRDAPLFRELQRVMASSSGPVNWELARQVGVATAVEAGEDSEPSEADRRSFEEAARVAELHVSTFTGLDAPAELSTVVAVRRAAWVNANAESLKASLEPAAQRLSQAIEQASREQMPPEAQAMAGFMGQLSPLLMGTQIGQVLGFLAQRVFGQYDAAVPRSGPGTIMFVAANIAAFERDWSLEPTDFRTYVALHEVTHRFEFAQPWAAARFQELLADFVSTLSIDVEGMQSRLSMLDAAGPEALQSLAGDDDLGFFGSELDVEQKIKLGRIQAFMSAAEGYADHVMHEMGKQMLPSYPRIEEAMRRYREGETGDPVFERLLGIEMKREQYAQGRAFCDAVVDLADEATLARMWDSAEAMPSLPEIEEPRLWLARTV